VFKEVNPVLPCKDVATAIEFYVEKIGFALTFHITSQPQYAGIRRDNVELHLQWHDPEEWEQVERPMLCFLVEDVDALYDELKSRGLFNEKAPLLRDTPWGTREFAVFDPFSNGLTFYKDL
jgi:uncharacterized glyoxalase superfamily protein PhnB